jgi:hypothetical protein
MRVPASLWSLLGASLVGGASLAAPPRVRIEPASIDLTPAGPSARPVVDITGAAKPPVLYVNVGGVGAPVAAGPGRWRAELLAPEQWFPQMAVVLVVADEGTEAAYLPMRGRAELPVESDPGAEIEVMIEAARFGPVRADGRGRASVPIVVAPGQKRATVRSTRAGKSTVREVDIPLPGYPRATTSLPAAPAAGAALTLSCAAVDADDRPAPATELVVSFAGRAVAAAARGAVAEARVVVPTRAGLELAVACGTRRALAQSQPRVAPAAPSRLAVRGLPGTLRVGTGASLAVEVDATDPWDNASATHVTIDAGELVLVPAVDAPGRWRGTLRVEDRPPRVRAPVVTVRAGPVSERFTVTLVGGAPARIELEAPDRPLAPDGRDRGTLRALVFDRHGLPTSATTPDVALGGGDARGAWQEEGVYAVEITIPEGAAELPVRAVAGAARADTVIEAAHPLGALAFELGAGVHSNFGAWLAPVVAAHVGWRFFGTDGWGFGVGAWSSLLFGAVGDGDGSASLRVLPLGGGAFVQRRLGAGWLLEAAGGAGAAFAHVVVEEGGAERITDTIAPTGFGMLGAGRALGPGWVVLVLRGQALGLDAETGVEGRLGGLGATLGYRYGVF